MSREHELTQAIRGVDLCWSDNSVDGQCCKCHKFFDSAVFRLNLLAVLAGVMDHRHDCVPK